MTKDRKNYKMGWVTDLHIDHCTKESKTALYNEIKAARLDGLVVTGDITTAKDMSNHIYELADCMAPKDLFFVLGNHDYWGSSLYKVRRVVENLTEVEDHINYLPACDPVSLSTSVALVGVDGWYDGRVGCANPPKLIMNGWRLMDDYILFNGDPNLILMKSREIAEAESEMLRMKLTEACQKHNSVIIATHFPPWREAAWHRHHLSDDTFAPWFTSITVGETIEDVAAEYPLTNFLVLTGHTHSSGEYWPANNIRCRTGKPGSSDYGEPRLVEIFSV